MGLVAVALTVWLSAPASPPVGANVERPDPARPLVYVAIGASDTVGFGAADPTTQSWVAQLHRRLPAESQLINLGVWGARVRHALVQQAPAAIQAKPDVITVWLAVNDFNDIAPLSEYRTDLAQLLDELQVGTQALILVGNVPDMSLVPWYQLIDPSLLRLQIRRWNAAIAEVVQSRRAILVDLYPAWAELADHPEYLSEDGFHPSEAGYRRIADLYWQMLERQASATAR